ncbi:acyl-CoA thioesterase [Psychrobacter sp. I-STPA6b]|uniref:acyl-CoA thioesterase n=1 Tax=Psychrobacter sp. I-STPA6b TaxID=2585718 RepID=UPI001D0CD236|nr:thioesterase family protein [Psychrobacter sp. I-STPA6b]
MTKMNIELVDSAFVFETVMRVRGTETDMGQHMTIEALTASLVEARTRFFYSRGIKEVNADYQGLIVNDIAVNVISRARAREELLYEVGVRNLNHEGGDIIIKVSRMFDTSLVAKAQMGFVCYDYRLNQVITLNETMLEALDIRPFEIEGL